VNGLGLARAMLLNHGSVLDWPPRWMRMRRCDWLRSTVAAAFGVSAVRALGALGGGLLPLLENADASAETLRVPPDLVGPLRDACDRRCLAGPLHDSPHRFEHYAGLYVLHCHNLEHEDAEMMLNLEVV